MQWAHCVPTCGQPCCPSAEVCVHVQFYFVQLRVTASLAAPCVVQLLALPVRDVRGTSTWHFVRLPPRIVAWRAVARAPRRLRGSDNLRRARRAAAAGGAARMMGALPSLCWCCCSCVPADAHVAWCAVRVGERRRGAMREGSLQHQHVWCLRLQQRRPPQHVE